jgi:iron complex outermembrane receptor protein
MIEISWPGQRHHRARPIWVWLLIFGLLGLASPGAAAEAGEAKPDLGSMSLSELMQLEVTSVSRQPEELLDAPAAISVLTREEIRRSGCTTLPDLLRLVPGVQVGQTSSSIWSVSVRGFAGRFSAKLLVLIDGRSVYTPLFSGVYWEVQDLPLDEIERIEVIRGPGATLWGANAVNGVINVITRRAVDSQGGFVQAGTGNADRALASARYGAALGPDTHVRAWARYAGYNPTQSAGGQDLADRWDFGRAGFRADWDRAPHRQVSVEGAYHRGKQGTRWELASLTRDLASPTEPYLAVQETKTALSGGHLLTKWQQRISGSSEMSLQLYFDRDNREDSVYGEHRSTYDLDLQHRFDLHPRLGVIWGGGYRRAEMRFVSSDHFSMLDGRSLDSRDLRSGFVQADIEAIPRRLQITGGVKLEHQDQLDLEVQPSTRFLWRIGPGQAIWGALSRAVRTPSIAEQRAAIWIATVPPYSPPMNPNPIPVAVMMEGSGKLASEVMVAWEAGYRSRPTDALLLDATVFLMKHDRIRGFVIGAPSAVSPPPPDSAYMSLPVTLTNLLAGEVRGVELASDWYARRWLRLRAAYSYLNMRKTGEAGASQDDAVQGDFANRTEAWSASPSHQAWLWASLTLGRAWDLDLTGRYVSAIPAQKVHAYTVLDARLAWRPSLPLEISVAGRNLGPASHEEFFPEFSPTTAAIKPALFAAVTLSW